MSGPFFGGPFFGGGFFGSADAGVRGKKGRGRELVVRLSEVKSREDTAEFLKSQLRLKHPNSAFVDANTQEAEKKTKRLLAKQERREKEMRLRADREAATFAKEAEALAVEQAKKIRIENHNAMILLMLGSAV